MLGSHTGGLTCSLQPAIHNQLLTTAKIAGISFQGRVLLVLLLIHCLFIVAYLILLFSTIEHNPTVGSHTGGLLGSLQPSIQAFSISSTLSSSSSARLTTILPLQQQQQ